MALLDDGRTGVWNRVRRRILARDHNTCLHCGAVATDVDHIVPRVMGGDDTYGNLQSLCKRCHKRKSAQDHLRIRAALQGAIGAGGATVDHTPVQVSGATPVLQHGGKTGRPSLPSPPPQGMGEGLRSPFQEFPT